MGNELLIDEIHCHHKTPLGIGGTDKYSNLIIIHHDVHILIHSISPETQKAYLELIKPDKKVLGKINELRVLAGSDKL